MSSTSLFWVHVIAITVHSITSLGFLIRLLVHHDVISSIYFSEYHGIGGIPIPSVVSFMDAAAACCAMSAIYALASGYMIYVGTDLKSHRSPTRICDMIFYPILLMALVNISDIIQLCAMIAIYSVMRVVLFRVFDDSTRILSTDDTIVVVVLGSMFWFTYVFAMSFNYVSSKPGSGVAQCFAGMTMLHDIYCIYKRRLGIQPCLSILGLATELVIRFIVLVCVFVETV